jgi:phosphoglycerol transferase MdoB-like AlkP superfamily enzyme
MSYSPPNVNPYAPSMMPTRPFGVALLAVLIGIYAVLLIIAGVVVAALSGVITFYASLGFLGLVGLALGIVLLVMGLILLGVALGLWHQRLWALILCLIVLAIFIYSAVVPWTGVITFWLIVEVILFVYLIAVHRHFL